MSRDIRPARPADAAGIARIHVEGWREAYGHFLSAEFLDARDVERFTRGWMRTLNDQPVGTSIAVLDVDGDIRGFAMSGPPVGDNPPRDLELYSIYQLSTEYGSGSGAGLLTAVTADAPATLWVAELAPRARAFYGKQGFVETGERKTEETAENLIALRMVR